MRQKVVYKVQMSSNKNRSKALSTAAGENGVSSVKIGGGEEKDKVVVIGDEVDIVGLAMTLKKKVGHTSIVTVRVLNDGTGYDEAEENQIQNHNQLLALGTNYHPSTTNDYYHSQYPYNYYSRY